ncbi:MAG: protein kinase [Polyangiales bacterium]
MQPVQVTAQAALEAGSLARLRVLTVAMLLLVQIGVVTVALFEGEALTRRVAWGALATLAGLFGYGWLRLGHASVVDQRLVQRLALPMSAAVVAANYAFGFVSIFCGAVTLALLLFASAVAQRTARVTFAALALGFVGVALLVRQGTLPYAPILPLVGARSWQWDVSLGAVLGMYSAAYIAGRLMRREMSRVVERFELAARDASYRNALLREAYASFKQSAGIGAPGRFTTQVLEGFRVGELLGRGPLGEVYAAHRDDRGTDAALKLLRPELLDDPRARQRFEQDVARASAVSSPHVVRVLGRGTPSALVPFVAMERLEGTDLGSYLRERGRLSLDEVCDLVRQLAAGLTAAHEHGLLHGALKPSNVFRAVSEDGPEPVWKLLDLGVAQLTRGPQVIMHAPARVGVPQYLAPEQSRTDGLVGPATDVYGLAAVAYRALTGEAPFGGELPAVLAAIADDMPAAPGTRVALPRDVDLAFVLGLAKHPADRLASPSAFAQALSLGARNDLDGALRDRARKLLKQRPYRA